MFSISSTPSDERNGRAEQQRFSLEVASILQSFDRAKEWADLSNCLQKLYKAFSKAGRIEVVPHREVIAKRLAQCLNPQLPSGVHTKALENYAIILQIIGVDGLCSNLATISSGLLPFFHNSASHVKPLFLNLIDHYYVPLGKRIRPCLTSLLVSLLSGVEDEKDDCFQQAWGIIEKLDSCVGEEEFMNALWFILLRTDRVRLPALLLLSNRLEKVASNSNEVKRRLLPKGEVLFLKAAKVILEDENVLVRRLFLDILVHFFPFINSELTQFEQVRILGFAMKLLPSREWSLTRRFIQWITNTSDSMDPADLVYFSNYVKDVFIESVALLLTVETDTKAVALLPLKILNNLLTDSYLEGLSGIVMPDLTISLLSYISKEIRRNPWHDSIMQEAQLLYKAQLTDPMAVWDALSEALGDSFQFVDQRSCIGILELSNLYFDHLSSDVPAVISLDGFYSVGKRTFDILKSQIKDFKDLNEYSELLRYTLGCLKRIEELQTILLAQIPKYNDGNDKLMLRLDDGADTEGDYMPHPQFQEELFAESIDSFYGFYKQLVLNFQQHSYAVESEVLKNFKLLSSLLVTLYRLRRDLVFCSGATKDPEVEVPSWFDALIGSCLVPEIQVCCAGVQIVLSLLHNAFEPLLVETIMLHSDYCQKLLTKLWNCLTPNFEGSHAEIVNLLLALHDFTKDPSEDILNAIISEALSNSVVVSKTEGINQFAIFWKYSHILRPNEEVFPEGMVMILDYLDEVEPLVRYAARNWAADALHNVPHILNPLFRSLLYDPIAAYSKNLDKRHILRNEWMHDRDQLDRILYIFGLFTTLLRFDGQGLVEQMQEFYVSDDILELNVIHSGASVADNADTARYSDPSASHESKKEDPPTEAIPQAWGEYLDPDGIMSDLMPTLSAEPSFAVEEALGVDIAAASDAALLQRLELPSEAPLLDAERHSATTVHSGEGGGSAGSHRSTTPHPPPHSLPRYPRTIGDACLELAASPNPLEWCIQSQDFGSRDNPLSGSYEDLIVVDYVDLFFVVVLRFLRTSLQHKNIYGMEQLGTIRSAAIEFLKDFIGLIHPVSRAKEACCLLAFPLIDCVAEFIKCHDTVMQVQALHLLRIVMFKSEVPGNRFSPATQKILSARLNLEKLHPQEWLAINRPTDQTPKLTLENFVNDAESDKGEVVNTRKCSFGLASFEEGVGAYRSSFEMNIADRQRENTTGHTLCSLFIVSVESKRGKIPNLKILSEQGKLIPIIIQGIKMQYNEKSSASILESYVEFCTFTLKFIKPSYLDLVGKALCRCFSWLLVKVAQQNNIRSCLRLVKGLSDVVNHLFDLESGHINKIVDTASEGFQPVQVLSDFFMMKNLLPNTSSKNTVDGDSAALETVPKSVIESLPEMMESCLFTIKMNLNDMQLQQIVHRRDASEISNFDTLSAETAFLNIREANAILPYPDLKSLMNDLDVQRNKSIVFHQITKLFVSIFKRLPVAFCRSAYIVWTRSLLGEPFMKCILLLVLRNMKSITLSDFLGPMHDALTLIGCIEELKQYSLAKQTAAALHFRTCVIITHPQLTNDATEVWKDFVKLMNKISAQDKSYSGAFWMFSMILIIDSVSPALEFHLQSKKAKKSLSDLMHHLLQIASLKFDDHNEIHKNAGNWEYHMILPPHIDTSISHSTKVSSPTFGWKCAGKLKLLPQILFLKEISLKSSLKGQLTKSVVKESFSHYSLILLSFFCAEMCVANRRTVLTTLLLQSLCDGLPTHILPALHNRSPQGMLLSFRIMKLLMHLPFHLYPGCLASIRKPIIDIFGASSFFVVDRRTLRCWIETLRVVVTADSQNLNVILPAPHVGVFTSRESDMQSRVEYLKRLSFLIFCCPKDYFLPQLSAILERLMEYLRMHNTVKLVENLFLCMRVLLLKCSPSMLTPIWPVLLTELIKILSAFSEGEEQLVIAALKVVDLASLLNLPDFHLYEWIFLSDSVQESQNSFVSNCFNEKCNVSESAQHVDTFYDNSLSSMCGGTVKDGGSTHAPQLDYYKAEDKIKGEPRYRKEDTISDAISSPIAPDVSYIPLMDVIASHCSTQVESHGSLNSVSALHLQQPNFSGAKHSFSVNSYLEQDISPSDYQHETKSSDFVRNCAPIRINRQLPAKMQVEDAVYQLKQRSIIECVGTNEVAMDLILRSLENDFLESPEELWDSSGEDVDVLKLAKSLPRMYYAGFEDFVNDAMLSLSSV